MAHEAKNNLNKYVIYMGSGIQSLPIIVGMPMISKPLTFFTYFIQLNKWVCA